MNTKKFRITVEIEGPADMNTEGLVVRWYEDGTITDVVDEDFLFIEGVEVIEPTEPEYVLGDGTINGITINESIFDAESFGYKIIDRESMIDDLYQWIAEANDSDKALMKSDLEMLNQWDDEYIFSSISTNEFIGVECSDFDETCKELLKLNETFPLS